MTKELSKTLSTVLNQDNVKKRFKEILGEKSQGFISSVLNVVNNNDYLKKADPKTVMNAAVVAATLDLPIDPNLGFSYIVPYSGKAQFQLGYKGLIQLAQRSGQYLSINVAPLYKGELISFDRITEQIEIDYSKKESESVVGYVGYFKLLNGFEKRIYLSVEEIDSHGKRFSQTYKRGSGLWKDDFHSMAMKTVLKKLLSKWGVLSIEMQKAHKFDQSVIQDVDSEVIDYVDAESEVIDDSQPIEAVGAKNEGEQLEMKSE